MLKRLKPEIACVDCDFAAYLRSEGTTTNRFLVAQHFGDEFSLPEFIRGILGFLVIGYITTSRRNGDGFWFAILAKVQIRISSLFTPLLCFALRFLSGVVRDDWRLLADFRITV